MANYNLIDYDNCITNLTSSIEKKFNLVPSYKTLNVADELLKEKDYKNVIVMIFDGMGSAIIKKNNAESNFLFNNKVADFKSTYPPTTANCTTAYLSGKNPIETGWLGWSSHFESLNLSIDNFTNELSDTKEKISGANIANDLLKYEELGNRITKANPDVEYYKIGPRYFPYKYFSFRQLESRLLKICNEPGKKYIYVYHENPDHYMHEEGTQNLGVENILKNISKFLTRFEKKCTDTIAFISADHGQIDVNEIAFYTYYDLMSCLKAYPSCDSRTPFFFIKDDKKEQFKELFNKYFSSYYDLLTKKQAKEMHIFGYGNQHPLFDSLLGDFIGIAKSNYYFSFTPNGHHFKGHHAGLTPDEITIPLIVIKK